MKHLFLLFLVFYSLNLNASFFNYCPVFSGSYECVRSDGKAFNLIVSQTVDADGVQSINFPIYGKEFITVKLDGVARKGHENGNDDELVSGQCGLFSITATLLNKNVEFGSIKYSFLSWADISIVYRMNSQITEKHRCTRL